MVRFSKNRSWTLILALGLCLACLASQPVSVRAGGPILISDGNPGSDSGDPDVPTTPPRQRAGRGAMQAGGRLDSMRSEGDGRITVRVVMWRVLVMVRGLRGFYFHF